MAKKHKHKSPGKGDQQSFADKRTMNPPNQVQEPGPQSDTAGHQPQDDERRLGNYEGTGEHARTGKRGQ